MRKECACAVACAWRALWRLSGNAGRPRSIRQLNEAAGCGGGRVGGEAPAMPMAVAALRVTAMRPRPSLAEHRAAQSEHHRRAFSHPAPDVVVWGKQLNERCSMTFLGMRIEVEWLGPSSTVADFLWGKGRWFRGWGFPLAPQ